MNEELVSILIPCYNTEKYLTNCLNSVVNQTYTNLEILVLNDGSTDGSLKILEEFAQKDSRIKIISRENRGIAYSRNELIQKSIGKYIMFVDSDDTVVNVIVENLYKALKDTNSEIAMCDVNKIYIDDKIVLCSNEEVLYNIFDRVQTVYNLISKGDYYDYPVAKLFSKSTFDGVEFPLNRIYEDSATVFKVYCNANKVVVLNNAYYNYLLSRENSITTKKYGLKNLNDNYLAINDRFLFLKDNMPELINEIKMGYIRNILTLIERAYYSEEEDLIQSNIVKELISSLKELYCSIDDYKNRGEILNNYKLACLFLLINNDLEQYKDIINFVKNN